MSIILTTILLLALYIVTFGNCAPILQDEAKIETKVDRGQETKAQSHPCESNSFKSGLGNINSYFRRLFNCDRVHDGDVLMIDEPLFKNLKKRSIAIYPSHEESAQQCDKKKIEQFILDYLGPKFDTFAQFSEKFPQIHEIGKRNSKVPFLGNRFISPLINLNNNMGFPNNGDILLDQNTPATLTKRESGFDVGCKKDENNIEIQELKVNNVKLKKRGTSDLFSPFDSKESECAENSDLGEPNSLVALDVSEPIHVESKPSEYLLKSGVKPENVSTFNQISKRDAKAVSDLNQKQIMTKDIKLVENKEEKKRYCRNTQTIASSEGNLSNLVKRSKRDVQNSGEKKDNPNEIKEEINKVYQDISDNVKVLSKLQEKTSQGNPRIMKRSFYTTFPFDDGSKRHPRCSQEMTVEMDTNRDATPDKLEHIERKTAEEVLQVNIPLKCNK